mmetsp:Transcript_26468/g.79785  ORF Transcript_26468/g.79785 Transcript_26468/m.79785 type:complete len:479 (+) Transcript_26468:1204-2640(+)
MGNAPATPPALEEVEAAEAHANELARAYFAAALRAKTLRMARAVAGADEWVPLRATRGDKRRFMKSDRAAAMAKYVWFRRAVRERRWRGYRLYDYDLGCHGWMISDETRADVFLRRFEDGTFTVTSEFRTRYDLVGDETFVFRDLDEFLKRFPHASSLDHHVEEHDDAADDDDDEHDPTRRLPGFGEPWAEQKERIRRSSPIGNEPGWGLLSCIVKSNDDLRQEVCALQIIAACDDAFRAAGLSGDRTGLWLRHYSIVPTGASTGIIETMSDAISLDSLKKSKGYRDLRTHLAAAHGGDGSARLARARRAFISSHAAYSLVSHILGLKDRHNGNILIDSKGHVVHIDFGFLLGQAPGGSFSLERVPFKLTAEHVDAMGGWQSDGFADFVVLLCCGFTALQRHATRILQLVEVMARDSPFPCFKDGTKAVDKMRRRMMLHLTSNEQVAAHVAELVRQSYNAYGTRQYDSFQYLTNGIYS